MQRPGMVMTLIILALSSYAVVSSLSWGLDARLFPMMIGIPVVLLCVVQLVFDLRAPAPAAAGGAESNGKTEGAAKDWAHSPRAVANVALWFVSLFLFLWVLGFAYGLPLFLFTYLVFRSREPLRLALAVSLFTWLLVTFGMERFMHVSFPPPLIRSWLAQL